MPATLDTVLASFKQDVIRHELFLKLEAKILNPASGRSRPRSETLLSAYVSLSCGRFESFLQETFYHAADDLRIRIGASNDARITKVDKFHWQNMHGFIRWAASAKGVDSVVMENKIAQYSQQVSQGFIFPDSFKYTHANPNSETVRNMFSRFGVENAFGKISTKYLDARNRNFSDSLIKDKLDSFVKKRHEAAHHGRIPGLTRVDAEDDHVFIMGLAEAVKVVIAMHIEDLN